MLRSSFPLLALLCVLGALPQCKGSPKQHVPRTDVAASRILESLDASRPEATVVAEVEEASTKLPAMEPFDEAALKEGMTRLSSCKAYDAYVKRALIAHRLRAKFPARFGTAIGSGVKAELAARPNAWAVDDDWLYFEKGRLIHLLDARTRAVHVVDNEMYEFPAIQAAQSGFMFFGRTSDLSGAKYVCFDQGKKLGGWVQHKRGGPKEPRYAAYRHTSLEVYSARTGELKYLRVLGQSGELLAVHVDAGSKAAYVVLLTEPHIAPSIATQARIVAEQAVDYESAREILDGAPVSSPEEARPRYSWQVNPRGGRTPSGNASTRCEDIWVPNDDRTIGDQLLAVHRFDLESLKTTSSMAIAVGDFIWAAAGDRLYIARRLRGRELDGSLERPVSEVDVFVLGTSPELAATTRVDGVPRELTAGVSGALLTTTRHALAETLVYAIDGLEVGDEPEVHPAGLRLGEVLSEPSWNIWAARIPLRYQVVFTTGDTVVGAVLDDRRLRFDALDASGQVIATAQTGADQSLLKWRPTEITTSAGSFLVPVTMLAEDGDERSILVGRVDDGGITLSSLHAPVGEDPRLLLDGQVITAGALGASWIPLPGGVVTGIRWRDTEPTQGGRPVRSTP